ASMVTAIAVCGLIGCLNGFLITRLRLPPFLATLGTGMIIYGFLGFLAHLAFNLPPPPHPIPDNLGDLANHPVLKISSRDPAGQSVVVFPGISWIIIITVVTAVLLHVASNRARMGRLMRLVGSNEVAARFSGVRVERVKLFAYTLAAALAALSGVLLTSRLGLPPGGAVGYEMVGITCAMIGGASLSGGVGSIGGTVVGSLIISVLSMGLTMLNNSNPALPLMFNGVVVLAAVWLDQVRSRRKSTPATRF
ncbi:MAG TPA: ABC transporter permease, partial [Spirochaetia bacterium]|nr:ABC transporter permease [Spirochaetia bacterium]